MLGWSCITHEFGWKNQSYLPCWKSLVFILTKNLLSGSRGAGSVIPPNSDIDFEMELLAIEGVKSDLWLNYYFLKYIRY